MIIIDDDIFHLSDGVFSYVFFINGGKLVHAYYGKALGKQISKKDGVIFGLRDTKIPNDWAPFEIGERGRCDFRIPSVAACGDGFASTDFTYVSSRVLKTKPSLGLPALRGEAETLEVVLKDDVAKLELKVYYSVYEGALARHSVIKNSSERAVTLGVFDSACTEFEMNDYDILSLDGRWGAECGITRTNLRSGIHTISSTRGVSSHQHNPFVALLDKTATENSGDVYGFNLIYSGNFAIKTERDEKSRVRVCLGASINEGGIELTAGESLTSPEAVSVYSDSGLGGMSRIFHKLYRTRLIDGRFADKIRPIVVNSWESTYFDFDEQKLKKFIEGAKGLGIDTVVLDDGWFGRRDRDDSSLGDWTIDKHKLPNGLKTIIDCCKANGMKFGIWFEPEAISPDSDLYRAHPEWAIATLGRKGMEMRNQYVLDFSNARVVDYIFESMRKILAEHDISYVKWDMNRPLSDITNNKLYFGYVRGVYDLYERLTKTFPNVLIEGCSSGGGRFDPAILYYSPMIWSSDDTDAHERTKIQYGLSVCYPLQTMSNHVSVCPNHQTGRTTPFATRGAIATLGCLGYELNVAEICDEEREAIRKQIADYRRDASLILTGDVYRLLNPFVDNAFCMEIVATDGNTAYVVYERMVNLPNIPLAKIKVKGLNPDALYRIEERNITATGAELMYAGLSPDVYWRDFGAEVWHISRIK